MFTIEWFYANIADLCTCDDHTADLGGDLVHKGPGYVFSNWAAIVLVAFLALCIVAVVLDRLDVPELTEAELAEL